MITGTELNSLIEVNTILEKQGFKVQTIDTIQDFREYEVCAVYGDTNEVYTITVDPIAETYTITHKYCPAA